MIFFCTVRFRGPNSKNPLEKLVVFSFQRVTSCTGAISVLRSLSLSLSPRHGVRGGGDGSAATSVDASPRGVDDDDDRKLAPRSRPPSPSALPSSSSETSTPATAVTAISVSARVVAGGFVSLLERVDKTFWFLSFHNVVKSFLYPALLKARPISHWSPYDPVRVVNADP